MSILEVPLATNVDNFDEQVLLEGSEYTLACVWNYRGEYWALSMADANSTPIISGVAMRVGVDMLASVSNPLRPPGGLAVYDTSGANADPGLSDLGGRVILLYQESV